MESIGLALSLKRKRRVGSVVLTRHAFTLIEMVVALMLGAVLLVAIGSVMRQAFTDWNLARKETAQGLGLMELRDQIARDLTNARRVRIGQDKIEMEGFLYRDPYTLAATQRLATVTYEIRRQGDICMLVRLQTQNDGSIGVFRRPHSEILYVGAYRMLASSDRVESSSAANAPPSTPLPKSPGAVKLLVLDQGGRVLVSVSHLRLGNAS